MPEPRVLLGGLGIPESPRWHEGRLWFCNWIDRQVVAVDLEGRAEVMVTRDPASHPMGYSIDWLPDGALLTTGDQVGRQEPDGSVAVHAEQQANEIVVDARGHAYVNGADYGDFVAAGKPPDPGYITADDRTLIIAESFAGRLTAFDIDADGGLSGRRAFAEGVAPDGICTDAEGAVWVGAGGFAVARVAEGGKVLQRVELQENRAPFAVMLGGPDRRTLFICTAEWHLTEPAPVNLARLTTGPRTGEILALPVDVPGAGRP
jgi:sugar lactone lactonase YvrE